MYNSLCKVRNDNVLTHNIIFYLIGYIQNRTTASRANHYPIGHSQRLELIRFDGITTTPPPPADIIGDFTKGKEDKKMAYNYMESVKADVKDYIEENIDLNDFSGREELENKLNDDLWVDDSVTGNASGSYTFNTYKAEENLAHNWDLLVECANEFGEEPIISDDYKHGAEFWDVSIRCYLLGSAISEVLDEMEKDNELIFED